MLIVVSAEVAAVVVAAEAQILLLSAPPAAAAGVARPGAGTATPLQALAAPACNTKRQTVRSARYFILLWPLFCKIDASV